MTTVTFERLTYPSECVNSVSKREYFRVRGNASMRAGVVTIVACGFVVATLALPVELGAAGWKISIWTWTGMP